MVLSMFNEMLYQFTCPHCEHPEAIVLSRLENVTDWPCEKCALTTDLRTEPHRSEIEKLRDIASEIDKQRLQRAGQMSNDLIEPEVSAQPDEDEQAIGSAIGAIIAAHARANMAMLAAILSHLVEKQVLSAEDVRELLAGLEDVAQSASQSLPSSDPDRAEVDRLEVNTLRQLISLLRTALLR